APARDAPADRARGARAREMLAARARDLRARVREPGRAARGGRATRGAERPAPPADALRSALSASPRHRSEGGRRCISTTPGSRPRASPVAIAAPAPIPLVVCADGPEQGKCVQNAHRRGLYVRWPDWAGAPPLGGRRNPGAGPADSPFSIAER